MKDTRLYIADMLADLDAQSIITMTYTLDDTDNPTIVKNSFSKSITLPATDNNNAIFGRIYDLTRVTMLSADKLSGVYFNPLKRTPFALYIEGDLVESGYIQLTGINNTNGVPRYTIQAYGGLGDFLYSLMYDENGDKRNLASLDYAIEGYSGDHKNEMDFTINKEAVAAAWSNLPGVQYGLHDVITFVPAYNGVAKDFDSSHALVNYAGNALMGLPTTITEGDNEFGILNGYGLLEFKRSLDEAEVRDLRSYLQRPALSVRALFRACANPDNNGGYSVILDDAFFNEENTLYHDAYITLPMLSVESESEDEESATAIASTSTADDYIGGEDNTFVREIDMGSVVVSSAPTNATIRVDVPLSLTIESTERSLYTGVRVYKANESDGLVGYVEEAQYKSAIVAQIVVYDSKSGAIKGASSELALSEFGDFNRSWKVYQALDSVDRGVVNVKGNFLRNDGESKMAFVSTEDNNTFPLSVSLTRGGTQSIRVALRIQRVFAGNYNNISTDASLLFNNNGYWKGGMVDTSAEDISSNGYTITGIVDGSEVVISSVNLPSIATGSKVTKELLLSSTESPADYLLSYTKLFNLRFIKDVATKTITITPHYFDGDIVNFDHRIDRGQAINITPNVFSKKFMRMALDQPDTYFAEKYRKHHMVDYAQKRIDTGFTFNNDSEEVYQGNVYTSAIPCQATSPLFNTFCNAQGVEMFAPIADDPTLILANGNETTGYSTASQVLSSASHIDPAKTIPFSINKGYDLVPRMCYFEMNDNTREAVDISNNLVVFCQHAELKNSAGNAVRYWLTDDVPEMISLNKQNCYLLTASTDDTSGNTIAVEYTRLPLFLSMRLVNGIVYDSFDFAKSKESYIPNINYPEGVTLYERYWTNLYGDRMHIDTRKVSCMVNLEGLTINNEVLRKFYYFDHSLWLLNKVEDYDPSNNRLTKCEFIKVRNISSYYNAEYEETEAPEAPEGYALLHDANGDVAMDVLNNYVYIQE